MGRNLPAGHCRGEACRRPYKKYGGSCSESSPLLLTEGGTAQTVTGVEGTRHEFQKRPER